MTTTQDLRTLIARLQARPGEGTQFAWTDTTNPDCPLSRGGQWTLETPWLHSNHSPSGYTATYNCFDHYWEACYWHGNQGHAVDDWQHHSLLSDCKAVCEAHLLAMRDGLAAQCGDAMPLLAELPTQIARWLKRLDEADERRQNAESYPPSQLSLAMHNHAKADTLLATVTEDVQAWAVRLGVALSVGAVKEGA